MKKKSYFLILLFSSIDAHWMESQAANAISVTELANVVSANVNEMMQQPKINSASVAITYNGVKHIAHFGELTKGKSDTPKNNTIYEIGSGSKIFTGALVAEAVVEGKLSLDDRVSQYMPSGFENFETNETPITLRHLLTHTAGLPNMLPLKANSLLENFTDKRTPIRLNKVIQTYTKSHFFADLKELSFEQAPGRAFSYSNVGPELLAYILEQVHGESYELILGRFTNKLKMTQTKISLSSLEQRQLAIGYHMDNLEPASPMSTMLWGAAGNLKSTTTDILNFLQFQLDGNNEISVESHKILHKGLNGEQIAYKWNISNEFFFDNSLHHHGGVPRAQNYIIVAPEKNFGLFIITNQSGAETHKILREALNGIMNDIEDLQT